MLFSELCHTTTTAVSPSHRPPPCHTATTSSTTIPTTSHSTTLQQRQQQQLGGQPINILQPATTTDSILTPAMHIHHNSIMTLQLTRYSYAYSSQEYYDSSAYMVQLCIFITTVLWLFCWHSIAMHIHHNSFMTSAYTVQLCIFITTVLWLFCLLGTVLFL